MSLAHAVSRRSQLRVNSQAYPGFVSYIGNDSALGVDGLCLHSATVVIHDHPSNPTGLDDRADGSIWVFGQKLELWVELSAGGLALHPRGSLYLINCHYHQGELTVECGCLLSLLKVLGVADLVDEGEEWPTLTDTKLYTNSAIAAHLDSKLGHSFPAIPGQTWGAISPSGSLVDYLGSLAFANSDPGVLWAKGDAIQFAPVNFKAPAQWLSVTLGKGECSYSPIASSLPAIRELVVSGQLRQPKAPEPTETVEEDGTTETTEEDKEYGPESLIDPNASDNEVLFATVYNTERVSPGVKYAETKRIERVALVFPSAKVNRDNFVTSYRKRNWQHFDANGRLTYEEEKLEECFGKVYNGWLSKRSNWIVSNPGNLGFDGASVGLGTTYADELLTATALVRSSYTKTTYTYNDRGEVAVKLTVSKEPGSKVATGSPELTSQAYTTSYIRETWKQRGKNQSHTIVAKYTFEGKYASQVEALQKSRYDALVASGNNSTIQVSTFTRAQNGTVTLGTAQIPQDMVGLKSRLSLVTDSKKSTKKMSRAGLETPPATEYLPTIKPKDEANPKDSLEDVDVKTSLKWKATLLAKAPKEVASVGLVDSMATLKAIAAYLFALRQGQAKSYEILLPLTDPWLTDYAPGKRVDIVISGQVVSHIASGVTYKSEPNQNLVLIDGLWIGGMPGQPASLVGGAISSPGISAGDPVYVPQGWGIPPGNYTTQPSEAGFQLIDDSGVPVPSSALLPGGQLVNLKPQALKPAFEFEDSLPGGVRLGGSVTVIDLLAITSSHTGGLTLGGHQASELNPYFDLMSTCLNTDGLPGGRVLTASNVALGGVVNVIVDDYANLNYGDLRVYRISDLGLWPDPSTYTITATLPLTGASNVNLGAIDGQFIAFFAIYSDTMNYQALRTTYDRASNTVIVWGFPIPLSGGG